MNTFSELNAFSLTTTFSELNEHLLRMNTLSELNELFFANEHF